MTNAIKQQKNEVQKAPQQKLIEFEKTLGDSVQNRVSELSGAGRLHLPSNYSVGNALQSAWLKILQTKDKNNRPALDVCTRESVANALLDMAILGLNPAKDHGYFIVYGDKLTWFTSYFGKAAAIKRIDGIETEPIGTVIYEGDEVELGFNELGEETVLTHKTSWANKVKNNLVGVYAAVTYKGIKRSAVMTLADCLESWSKSQVNKTHTEFRGEYMKRTAINRLVKMILKTTNDDDLLAETIIENENQHYDFDENNIQYVENEVKKEIATNANIGEVVDIHTESTPTIEAEPIEHPAQQPVQKEEPKQGKSYPF